MPPTMLAGDGLVLGYGSGQVVHGVSIDLEAGRIVALIGPNGSGKSTVLRSLARLHPVEEGGVTLDRDGSPCPAAPLSAREFARHVTLLSQSRPNPSGLRVRDVVAFGRHPHRRRFSGTSPADVEAVERALALTGTTAMAERGVDQLSGGEIQRVWLATCLAQDTDVVLLDEPTNHLDLRFQVEVLDLARTLADEHGKALGLVLHDLNHAAMVADEVVLLSRGRTYARGCPEQVLTAENLSEVYGLPVATSLDPGSGLVRVEPAVSAQMRRRRPTRQTGPSQRPAVARTTGAPT